MANGRYALTQLPFADIDGLDCLTGLAGFAHDPLRDSDPNDQANESGDDERDGAVVGHVRVLRVLSMIGIWQIRTGVSIASVKEICDMVGIFHKGTGSWILSIGFKAV